MSGKVDVNIDMEIISREVARYTDEGIKAIADAAKARAKASSAFADKSGKLRKSIKTEKSKKRRKKGETVYLLRAMAPHAHLIEYGHAMVTHDGRVVGHVAAHPFIQPAVDSVLPEAEQIAAAALSKIDIKV